MKKLDLKEKRKMILEERSNQYVIASNTDDYIKKSKDSSVESEIKRRLVYWLITITLSVIVGFYTYNGLTSRIFTEKISEMPDLVKQIYPLTQYIFPIFSIISVILFNMNFAKYMNYDFGATVLSIGSGFVGQLLGSLVSFAACVILMIVFYVLVFFIIVVFAGVVFSIFDI